MMVRPVHPDACQSAEVELTVVIPMRNSALTIVAQLESLRAQEWSGVWEIIVADNGSDDGGPSVVRSIEAIDPRVRLVDASVTRGPSFARNVGVAHARGDSIAFCDADDVVAEGWLAAMGAALQSSSAVTGPLEQHRLNPPWLADVYGSRLADSPQCFAGVFPFGPSSNLGIRRRVFLDLGGFDPALQVGEDVDLCMRLWLVGRELRFVPTATVHYRNRTDLRGLWTQALHYGAAGPMIVRRVRRLGLARPSRFRGLRNWLWLMRSLPTLRSQAGRARWVVVAGGALGRAISSVRHRALFL